MSISFKVIREIDKLGRVVIPSDLRKTYGLKPNDKLIIEATDIRFYIKKEE